MPEPPTRFTITNGWGSRFSRLTISASVREMTSPPLPAEVCTVISTGFTGYACAGA
jgi:hypothetical protein